MQTLKNKAFRVSVQLNALVRKLLALARGGFTLFIQALLHNLNQNRRFCLTTDIIQE